MSIINQMLNDLEKRTHTPMDSNTTLPIMLMTGFHPDEKSLKKIYRTIAIILFVACFLIYLMNHLYSSRSAHSDIITWVKPTIIPLDTPNYPAIAPLHVTPAILTAITLQLDKETTSLRLLLSQDALYQVETNKDNQLIIVLENARLVASIPPINTINSAINNIQMINQPDGKLKIILTLKPNSELTHLDLNETSKLPELQLDFVTPNIPDVTQAQAIDNNVMTQQNKAGSIIKLRTDISLNDQYQEALQLSSEGKKEEALKLLTSVLAKNPDYSLARELLASLLITQGRVSQAQQIIKIGLQQHPFYPAYVKLKARMFVNAGKVNEALNLLQLAPPELTSDPNYYAYIAALYQRQGKYALSEKLYEQLLALEPNNATWWIGVGIASENMGKAALAMNAYMKAAHSDSLNPELRVYASSRIRHLQS